MSSKINIFIPRYFPLQRFDFVGVFLTLHLFLCSKIGSYLLEDVRPPSSDTYDISDLLNSVEYLPKKRQQKKITIPKRG